MKICIRCGLPKEIVDFYHHPMMADGRLNKCKECCKTEAKKRRQEKLDEIRAYDRERGKLPHRLANSQKYQREHLQQHFEANQKYFQKYPEKREAHYIVGNAIRDGKLIKQPCMECGSLDVEAHHDDYSKPLDVIWVCNKHHKQKDKERRLRESESRTKNGNTNP